MLELDKRDDSGYCAAHYSCMYNNLAMLKKLHDAGASLKRKRKHSFDSTVTVTVFSLAKENEFSEIMDYMISVTPTGKTSANHPD